MNTLINRENAHNEIDHIFKDLLPAQGMKERPEQMALCHRMLEAMMDGGIALCDAGTGIGKTFAYLVAGTVYHRFRTADGLANQPIIISTSSIALQRAVMNEYLPLLSSILMADGKLAEPLRAVVRKGKAHYVCDQRLQSRLRRVDMEKKNPQAAAALLSLRDHIDMDEAAHLSGYDRDRVCVPQICDCRKEGCRYLYFMEICASNYYPFQICNHNLLLADAIHRRTGKKPILPEHCALVVDEAHKLPDTARQMFGRALTAEDIRNLIRRLRQERYVLAADVFTSAVKPLLADLSMPWDEQKSFEEYQPLLKEPGKALGSIQKQLGRLLSPAGRLELEQNCTAFSLFCEGDTDMVFYAAEDEDGKTMLCASVTDLTAQLRATMWSRSQGMVLTSGTMAIGNDFRRFREETGLIANERVREFVSHSPFDYRANCLLYLPQFPPHIQGKETAEYYNALTEEITGLLDAAHGHALVLFNSYAAMSAVKDRLKEQDLKWPLFTMGRNAVHTTQLFKESPGAVLLATGAAWEGFDFPGDCVSLLVIPRLPFAYPDTMKEKERENYATLHEFIQAVVVPEMQIKLRQGFGRAIRTETDTCVIAILDDRSGRGHRYHKEMLSALPELRQTSSLRDVERFIRQMKEDHYFTEGSAG